jgi:hypothetical protein
MNPIQRISFRLLAAVALVALCGCSKGYYYELTCAVYNVSDGKPLAGVQAVVDTDGHGDNPSYGHQVFPASGSDGRLKHKFYVPMGSPQFKEPWYLKLTRDGFVPELVEIKPGPEPKEAGSTTSIFVVVYMRPKTP